MKKELVSLRNILLIALATSFLGLLGCLGSSDSDGKDFVFDVEIPGYGSLDARWAEANSDGTIPELKGTMVGDFSWDFGGGDSGVNNFSGLIYSDSVSAESLLGAECEALLDIYNVPKPFRLFGFFIGDEAIMMITKAGTGKGKAAICKHTVLDEGVAGVVSTLDINILKY